MKFVPPLDGDFIPMALKVRELKAKIERSGLSGESVGVKSDDSYIDFNISGIDESDFRLVERIVKSMLWINGGNKIIVNSKSKFFDYLAGEYSHTGKRSFDFDFMDRVYGGFKVSSVLDGNVSVRKNSITMETKGNRIGLDAGGTCLKVCACIDSKVVYSENLPWYPKENKDISYHYEKLRSALVKASAHLGQVDSVGISTAGICMGNGSVPMSSLFEAMDESDLEKASQVYRDVCKALDFPSFAVVNDGEAAALSAAFEENKKGVLGISMGTSVGGGYIDDAGALSRGIDELAFVPIDFDADAPIDPWSGDIGCGVEYLSSQAVVRLAEKASIDFADKELYKRTGTVMSLASAGDIRALAVFENIGICLGYALAYYKNFYRFNCVKLMGGVTSGTAGEIIAFNAHRVLKEEFSDSTDIVLPGADKRALGQAFAASMLKYND